jgi:glycosyltransferase involved in cell wall biosynthesis
MLIRIFFSPSIYSNTSMKVLVNTTDSSNLGGVANYYRILRPFLNTNIEYFTVGKRHNKKGKLINFIRIYKDYYGFIKKLKSNDYDIVHLNPSLLLKSVVRDALFLLISKMYDKKVVVFFRGWDPGFEEILRKYFLLAFKSVYCKADAYIVLSQEFKEKLKQMGLEKRTFIETTTVDEKIYQENSFFKNKRMKSNNTNINILFLARIEKQKGVYIAADAYKDIAKKYPNVSMTIAGDGPALEELKEYSKKNNIKITYTGYLKGDDKKKMYKNADIYLYPSYYGEGMPNAMLEAMAYGLPIIARPVGGIRDFFENSKMGFITESKSSSEYSELLERLITSESLRWKMGEYNRSYAQENFASSIVAKRLENIYRIINSS